MPTKVLFIDTADTLYHNPDFKIAQTVQPIKQLSQIKRIKYNEALVL